MPWTALGVPDVELVGESVNKFRFFLNPFHCFKRFTANVEEVCLSLNKFPEGIPKLEGAEGIEEVVVLSFIDLVPDRFVSLTQIRLVKGLKPSEKIFLRMQNQISSVVNELSNEFKLGHNGTAAVVVLCIFSLPNDSKPFGVPKDRDIA
jgi:hypothetical protein